MVRALDPRPGGQLTGLLATVHARHPDPRPLPSDWQHIRARSLSGDWSAGQRSVRGERVRIRVEPTVLDVRDTPAEHDQK